MREINLDAFLLQGRSDSIQTSILRKFSFVSIRCDRVLLRCLTKAKAYFARVEGHHTFPLQIAFQPGTPLANVDSGGFHSWIAT
ncbi:hypothetical protein GIB67_030963, partial [Kingdonia uniflora]